MFDLAAMPPAPRGPNVLALFAGIWLRPARTLRAIAAGPGWLWAVPVLTAVVIAAAASFAQAPAREAAQRAAGEAFMAARLQELPAEMRDSPPEGYVQVIEPSRVLTLWAPLALAVAGIAFGWLARAAVLHVASLALGGQQSFGKVYSASAWASFPLVLRTAVQALYALAGGGLVTSPGLSGLLPGAAPAASALAAAPLTLPAIILGRIDVYTLWYLVLLFIGVRAAGKLARGKTLAVVAIYAVLSAAAGLSQLLTRGLFGV